MDTSKLRKFAQFARRTLIGQVNAKLDSVLAEGAAARREHPEAMKKLEAAIARDGKGQVIERVAYIWFNRFSALRFMDVNDLNPVRVVSPLSGQFQPEILAEAKSGNIDEDRVPEKVRGQIRALLDGRTPSPDAQAEAYRLLLVAICNDWHKVMPFLFERIDDFTELLLPEDLLSNNSILAYTREAMTPDACEDVEVIGWLYQFYISEKKGRGLCRAEEKPEDHGREHSRRDAAVHPALDRPLPGREFAWPALDAQPPRLEARSADELLHRAGRAEGRLPAHLLARGDQGLRSGLRVGAHADLCLRPALRDIRRRGV